MTQLTDREREIAHCAWLGQSINETALHLEISPRTVKNHRANIKRKLGLKKTGIKIPFLRALLIIAEHGEFDL